jgi:hypothetical protein
MERRDRILDKLGPVWGRVPHWSLAWLIVNLVPAGRKASDAETEVELDRLLDLDPDECLGDTGSALHSRSANRAHYAASYGFPPVGVTVPGHGANGFFGFISWATSG